MNQHGETNNNQWKKFSMMYSRFRGTRKYCSATKVSNKQTYLPIWYNQMSFTKWSEMFDLKLKFVTLKYSEKILKYSTQNFEIEFVYE